MAQWIAFFISNIIRSITKSFLHWWTSSSEIERTLAHERHSVSMTINLFGVIARSKTVIGIKNELLYHQPLNVDGGVEEIFLKKKIAKKKLLIAANARLCLNSMKYVQEVEEFLHSMKRVSFEWSNEHHYRILDSFWSQMRPNVRRSSDTMCSDWGEVGFQGKDPATDFRGMGLLGLQQLVYFAGKEGGFDARRVLTDSMHPRRFYPFAAAGINITSFVLELLHEFRLNRSLYAVLETRRLDITSEDESLPCNGFGSNLISIGADVVNDLYCEVFMYFNDLWVKKDPPNVMHFKAIFNEVQDHFRANFETCITR